LAAFQHVFIEEFDELGTFGRAFFPFDAHVDVFGVFAEDDYVHALGMLHGRDAAVEIEDLAQGYVEGTNAASDGRGQRAFDGNAKFADGADGVIGEPVLKTGFGFLTGEDFVPGYGTLAVLGFFDGSIENAEGGFPATAASAVSFNERDDGMIGNAVFTVAVFDCFSVGWDGNSVERWHYTNLQ